MLEVKNLKTYFFYDDKIIPAVDEVSFSLEEGSILGMVGESGCGKTMTALSITRLLPSRNCKIAEGSIVFNGIDLASLPEDELRKKRGSEISYVFQEPATSLNPVLRIEEQMKEVIFLHRKDIAAAKRDAFIVEQLTEVGIRNAQKKVKCFPHQLSGGEKQRVMIAMAMVTRPKLLIADEPTTALDVTIQAQIIVLLQELRQKFGVSILFISHDINVIGELADCVAVMYAGQIVEYAKAERLMRQPQHPYTQGLFECLPGAWAVKRSRLNVLCGEVPKAGCFPQGCRFHPRCPKVFDRCRKEMPALARQKENQEVRCWLYSGSEI
ncbi:MAG: ABC transporter ATP-binding protein [Candidatus Omnitrophica bacterium]|nr:ABC transporter ATP-binding protein [Candidatus Omnitrophota bacterium]MBU4477916.1 ABC transporter ATP-binding protein [Candidatus Omnitrophota bacterium]MCG2703856.1 ABC transporter ATP-binding protein [Candidatus Omnitrophota bacterium]